MWQATGSAADRVTWTGTLGGRAMRAAAAWLGTARGLVLTLAGVAMGGVALVTEPAVARGDLSHPMLALLILVPLALAEVALPLADAGALSVRTSAAEQRLRRIERTPPAVRDTVASAVPDDHDLDVDRVRARWERGGPLTAAVRLHAAPGERIAVVGPSGSGKSTLAALLLRFLDPAEGRVLMGGHSTRALSLDDVRRLTGLVDDHPHVFATTLVENVRLARPDATDAEVEQALRRSCLGAWLDSLPLGLHTPLGDGHAAVSGGERARIGIARSLLADQPVLVLDEPAAHLDHATATRLALEVLAGPGDHTVIWITHTPVGLHLADRVVDLATPALRTDRIEQ
jgi:ATP-binding cassette subfamily C protein CydCD